MFTINADNKYYRRSLHKQIKIHLNHSQKLRLRVLEHLDKYGPEYGKTKCEQTGKYEAEILCWMVQGSSGPLEPLHYCHCQQMGKLLCSSHSHLIPYSSPSQMRSHIWSACSAFPIQLIGFPCSWGHCFIEQHESPFSSQLYLQLCE